MGRVQRDVGERIRANVEVLPNGCWQWLGYVGPGGYSYFKVGSTKDGSRRQMLGHRASYEHFVGPIPDGLQIDHACHSADSECAGGNDCPHRRCVNPEHLEPVTQKENLARGVNFERSKTHCTRGHEYDETNTRHSKGHRACRACEREKSAARRLADPEGQRAYWREHARLRRERKKLAA